MDTRKQDEQAKLWNGSAGCVWVEAQALLDRILQPFEDVLVEAASARGERRVLLHDCLARRATRSASTSRSR